MSQHPPRRSNNPRAAVEAPRLLALACALGWVTAIPAGAAEFNVTAGDVDGLAAAIVAANANDDCFNRINLPSGTWTLTHVWAGADAVADTGLPLIDFSRATSCGSGGSGGRSLEIRGVGMDATIIERAPGAPRFRHFAVSPGAFAPGEGLVLTDLALRGGDLSPTAVLDLCCMGGAINVDSSALTLDRVALLDNRATQGGAIAMQTARLSLIDSVLAGNSSARQGGALYGTGVLVATRTRFLDNTAGAIEVPDSGGQGGGAIFWRSDSASEIVESSIVGNRILFNARSGGGAQISGPVSIVRSEVRANVSTGDGGGLQLGDSFSPPGPFQVTDSTFSGNFAPGRGSATNVEPSGGDQGFFQDVTIASNEASPAGSAIRATGVGFINTLVAATRLRGTATAAPNCSSDSTISSGGYNLDSDGTCKLSGTGDVAVFNPADVLDLVARDNGGPTFTHALVRSGLAVDHGGPCAPLDQRGVTRPQDGDGDGIAACDVGAYELLPAGEFAFATFDVRVSVQTSTRRNDSIHAGGVFSLAAGSDGIDVLSQPVVFSIDAGGGSVFAQTLPAGSFQRSGTGFRFHAAPRASGITMLKLAATGTPGEFTFDVLVQGLDLPTFTSPAVTVRLAVGNDAGSKTLPCRVTPGVVQCN